MPAVESLERKVKLFHCTCNRVGENWKFTIHCASVRARVLACVRVCLCVRTCVRACMCVFVRICVGGLAYARTCLCLSQRAWKSVDVNVGNV